MKCKDCKFSYDWGCYTDLYKYGKCRNPIFSDITTDVSKGLFLMPKPEGWELEFFTHEDFGCIGFEKK